MKWSNCSLGGDSDMNAYLSVWVGGGGVWRGQISAFLMHRQPLHLLDLKPAGEEPSWSKDFLSPSTLSEDALEHSGMFEFDGQ